ncbi:MAG TPA: DHA2 family efflux MFS transporter permease subunit [Bryobacteraceae bacterium]|nr:DHA2 family efflux MFS transporter permease subunit [Bryobacteraceae bacterium]
MEQGAALAEIQPTSVSIEDWCPDCNPWLIAAAVIVPTFMEVLDTSIAAVILPHIAGSLSATTDEATWVLTSYLVANAVILPASSWFAIRFGRRNFLLFCIGIFTLASFACGAAQSLGMILLARAVQGAGGGALQPLSQSILLESFPPEKRGAAMAVFGLGIVVAPVIGPTLGGWLTDQYTWRWAFYINIPMGVLAVLMLMRFVKDPPYIQSAKPGRMDAIGLGLLALWIGTLQIILDKGQEVDWFGATWIRWAAVILVIGLISFLVRELVVKNPIVDLRIFRDRNFAVSCLLIGLFGAVLYGMVALLPLFYQTLLNYTAGAAGIAVSPRGIGAIAIMPIIGFLTAKMDNRYLIAAGFALYAWCALLIGNVTLQISQWSLLWPVIFSGAATGLMFVPLSTLAVGTLRNEQMGNASGLFNLLRNIGGSIGISLVETLVARRQQVHRTELSRYLAPGHATGTLARVQSHMAQHAGPGLAKLRAFALLQGGLTQQSVLYSYVDDFRYMALVCALCIPLVFLVKAVKAKRGAAAMG